MHITVCLLVGEELSIRCACLEVTARFEFANAVIMWILLTVVPLPAESETKGSYT